MESKLLKRNSKVMLVLVVLVFTILVGRLAYLQLYQVEKFKTKAQQNHMRLIPIEAPRGEIYASDGKTKLVSNKPVYTVSLVYLGLKNTPEVAERLAKILDIQVEEIQEKLDAQSLRLYEPIKISTNVPLETVLEIEQHRLELPGVVIDVEPVRNYPQGPIAAHVVGYVQQIQESQLNKLKDKGYRLGDKFGQAGLEYQYEEYLRGTAGARQVEVDAQARPIRDLGISQSVPGSDLVLSIDHKVQKAAESGLEAQIKTLQSKYPDAKWGSVVAVDVRTGGVIAMASYPTFDPEVFTRPITQVEIEELYDPAAMRFINRALSAYPPGSTYKMVVATAGLETGVINPDAKMSDPGYVTVDGQRFNDWQAGGHGAVDLRKAIQVSCNTYFYTYGLKIGQSAIADYSKQFGLGVELGIDLPNEQVGTVPTAGEKYNLYKVYLNNKQQADLQELEEKYEALIAAAETDEEKTKLRRQLQNQRMAINYDLVWHNYDTVISSIGQGINNYTPLQLATYTAAIANGGTVYQPRLVQEIKDHQGKTIKKFSPKVINQVDVSPEHLAIIRDGMHRVSLPGGTAYPLFADLPVEVASKTGTAEVKGKDNHAVVVAFAPVENPEIAVAAVVEHGAHGGSGAGPVVHDVLAAYFGSDELMEGKIVYTAEE
ncbi:penicillin-binding protein 2 [Peptococcaceae bacterium 1198_IL3148]